jgi:hypothetical protein
MSMKAIDVRIRRAGIDQNPGYLPWLKRKVLQIFEEDEDDHEF